MAFSQEFKKLDLKYNLKHILCKECWVQLLKQAQAGREESLRFSFFRLILSVASTVKTSTVRDFLGFTMILAFRREQQVCYSIKRLRKSVEVEFIKCFNHTVYYPIYRTLNATQECTWFISQLTQFYVIK